ncbi:MAG: spore coat U domain-containing protein [Desulfobulbaceae bacterium]|nr:spore coat U domain-containing protein [Desulfobulbaceae bacterium]
MIIKSCLFLILILLQFLTDVAANCTLLLPSKGDFDQSDGNSNIGPFRLTDIIMDCDAEYRLGLDGGLHLLGTRRLHDGAGNYITYYLWKDKGASMEWGNSGLEGIPYLASPLTGNGNGTKTSKNIFTTALGDRTLPPGTYNDRVRVVLAYPPYGVENTLSADLYLTLTLTGSCTLSTDNIQGFGEWPPDARDVHGAELGGISVTCTPGLNYKVGMDSGRNYIHGSRNMRFQDETIPYTIWANSSRTIGWGDKGLAEIEPNYTETHAASAQNGIGSGNAQNFSVWGDAQILGKKPGTYSDTVNITIIWH